MKNINVEPKYLCVNVVLFLFVIVVWLITRNDDNSSIPQLIKQNVISTSGVAWNTGELVTINPFDSKEINPCEVSIDSLFVSKPPPSYSKKLYTQMMPISGESVKTADIDCNGQVSPKIVVSENSSTDASLKQAIKISGSLIEGTVRVDGKDRGARFIVSVTALYTGSHCATTYSAGASRTYCVNNHAACVKLEKKGFEC